MHFLTYINILHVVCCAVAANLAAGLKLFFNLFLSHIICLCMCLSAADSADTYITKRLFVKLLTHAQAKKVSLVDLDI